MSNWEWSVIRTNFSRLDLDLKNLASTDFEIYQIICLHEVRPAKIPFEVVVISRKPLLVKTPGVAPRAFDMHYQPPVTKDGKLIPGGSAQE